MWWAEFINSNLKWIEITNKNAKKNILHLDTYVPIALL